MKQFTTAKQIGFVDGDYNDCINRWIIKRIAKRMFPSETEMRKLKVTYLGKYELGWLKLPHNVYKVVSVEGVCKFVSMSYDSYEGGYYYELTASMEFEDFDKDLKDEWKQLKNDFVIVYGKEPRNVRYCEDGYFTFEIGNETFPTLFRGSTNGVVSYVDPYTKEGYAIVHGKVESDSVTNWYQE